MIKILITGANSYIGTSFKKYLSKWSEEYFVDTVDMIDGSWRQKDFSIYDTVYHVAGIAHSDIKKVSDERKAFYYKINTELAIETASKAKNDGVKQFIFMSSAIIYGNSAPIGVLKVITKDTPPAPSNFYGDTKLKAEKGIIPLADDAFKVCILRPPMIYGKGSKGNYPVLAKLAVKLPFFPEINNQRSMLYIENLLKFVKLMIDNEEQGVFFPQNAEYINTSELVKMIAAVHGKKICLLKGFGWILRILSLFIPVINKAFGNLVYELSMSEYYYEYQIIDIPHSVLETENE